MDENGHSGGLEPERESYENHCSAGLASKAHPFPLSACTRASSTGPLGAPPLPNASRDLLCRSCFHGNATSLCRIFGGRIFG